MPFTEGNKRPTREMLTDIGILGETEQRLVWVDAVSHSYFSAADTRISSHEFPYDLACCNAIGWPINHRDEMSPDLSIVV